jgi:antitoxin component YwqK of YwqJK toxin-antitoxin module
MRIRIVFLSAALMLTSLIQAQEISADSLMRLGLYQLDYDTDTLHVFANPSNPNNSDNHCYDYYRDEKKIALKCYYDNNQISYETVFDEQSKKTGKGTMWYYNGQMSYQTHWEKGMINGKFQTWDKSGNLIKNGVLTDGIGIITEYWHFGKINKKTWVKENGILLKTQAFCNDTLIRYELDHMVEEKWFIKYNCENGRVFCEGLLLNGMEDGEWKFYNDDGTLEHIKTFREGVMIKKEVVEK